jgi:hypothetical protein
MRAARNGIGLVALAFGMVACVDATQPTTTGPAAYEGANVSMTGTTTVSVPTLDGKVLSATTHEWVVDGVVRNGIAEAARSPGAMAPNGPMPVLYISEGSPLARGRANHREMISGKDLNGNADDFVFVNAEAGPAKTMVHVGANRQVLEAYSFEWKKVNGGWRAMAFTATFFKNGKAIASVHSADKSSPPLAPSRARANLFLPMEENCMYDPFNPCSGVPVFEGFNPVGGDPLPSGCDCSQARTDYLLAASAAAAAINALTETGAILTPWGAIAAGIAATTAIVYLNRYNNCVHDCALLTADAGGGTTGAFFGSVDLLDSKYFRRGLT